MNYNQKIEINTKRDFLATRKYPSRRTFQKENTNKINQSTNSCTDFHKKFDKSIHDQKVQEVNKNHENISNKKKADGGVLWESDVIKQKERDKVFENKENKKNEFKEKNITKVCKQFINKIKFTIILRMKFH